jgi:hypothetical protein
MASFPFIPKGQEDLKWHQPAQIPRFQRQMENGVLFLRDPQGTASPPQPISRSQQENEKCHQAPQHEKIVKKAKIFPSL